MADSSGSLRLRMWRLGFGQRVLGGFGIGFVVRPCPDHEPILKDSGSGPFHSASGFGTPIPKHEAEEGYNSI